MSLLVKTAASAAIAGILTFCGNGIYNENNNDEIHHLLGAVHMLSNIGGDYESDIIIENDHLIGDSYMIAIIGGIIAMTTIMAVRRLALATKEAKPTREAVWIPSPSFISHMVVGAGRKEDTETEKIEEILEDVEEIFEILETMEEIQRPEEESLDSVAREIIETMEEIPKPEEKSLERTQSLDSDPGEPIAKSTPNEETAAIKDGMKNKIKRETTIVTIMRKYSPKK